MTSTTDNMDLARTYEAQSIPPVDEPLGGPPPRRWAGSPANAQGQAVYALLGP